MKSLLLLLVRAYQLTVSPYLGQNCRFYPTCSNYASEALRTHGALAGSALAARRLCKCHPWHAGGVDLVPAAAVRKETTESTDSPAAVRGCGPS